MVVRFRKPSGLRRAAQMPRGRFLPAGLYVAGIAQEAVLQLVLTGFLEPSEHAAFGGDLCAVFLAQVFGDERLEEDQAAGAVRYGVEKFHGDAVMIDEHPEGTFADIVEGDVDERIAFVLLDRRRLRDLLKVIPERAPAQPDGDGWEAAHRHIQRRAQDGHVHILRQRGGEAEIVRPAAALGGGIDLRRVVQPHPAELLRRREYLRHEIADRFKIGHVFVQVVEHIGVPALGRDDKLALTAAFQQLFVQHPRIIQHHFVAADEQQRRRQPLQITEER